MQFCIANGPDQAPTSIANFLPDSLLKGWRLLFADDIALSKRLHTHSKPKKKIFCRKKMWISHGGCNQVDIRRWRVYVPANKFHSFNFYLLFDSAWVLFVCVHDTMRQARARQSSCCEIVYWNYGLTRRMILLVDCVHGLDAAAHDTIYIYWMLEICTRRHAHTIGTR